MHSLRSSSRATPGRPLPLGIGVIASCNPESEFYVSCALGIKLNDGSFSISNSCSGRSTGYDMMRVVEDLDGVRSSSGTASAVHNLSRALILHPIACGIAFLSFLTALASHTIGFLFASLIAMIATVITLIAMIIDWVNFGVSLPPCSFPFRMDDQMTSFQQTVRHHVNGSNGPGHGASFASAIWLVTASFVILALGSLTVCCGCFTDRRRRGRAVGPRY